MIRDELKLYAAGISYKTSDIAVREKFQVNRKEIRETLTFLGSAAEVKGIVVVSTCNRVEFYMILQQEAQPFEILTRYYCNEKKLDVRVDKPWFYLYEGIDAAVHLLK